MKESNELRFVDDLSGQKPMMGILSYTIFKNGAPIETVRDENLILDGARNLMVRLIVGEFTNRNIIKIGLGVSGLEPEVTDTALVGSFEKDIDGYTFPAMGQVQFNWSLTTSEANGMSIREFGLVAKNGTLFARRIRENGKSIDKQSDISISGQWIIKF
jgi:hypothetical protein